MANSFPDVEDLRGRKLLDRSCKIAATFHLILKQLNAEQLKKFFVVSVGSSISRSPHHSILSSIAGNSIPIYCSVKYWAVGQILTARQYINVCLE
jgi:deoxyhypusine synthase